MRQLVAVLVGSWLTIIGVRVLLAVIRDAFSLGYGHGLAEIASAGVLLSLALCIASPFVMRILAYRSGVTEPGAPS